MLFQITIGNNGKLYTRPGKPQAAEYRGASQLCCGKASQAQTEGESRITESGERGIKVVSCSWQVKRSLSLRVPQDSVRPRIDPAYPPN